MPRWIIGAHHGIEPETCRPARQARRPIAIAWSANPTSGLFFYCPGARRRLRQGNLDWAPPRGFATGSRPLRPPDAGAPRRFAPWRARALLTCFEPETAGVSATLRRLARCLHRFASSAPLSLRCWSPRSGAVMSRDAICLTPNGVVRSTRMASNVMRSNSGRFAAIRRDAPHMLESRRT